MGNWLVCVIVVLEKTHVLFQQHFSKYISFISIISSSNGKLLSTLRIGNKLNRSKYYKAERDIENIT